MHAKALAWNIFQKGMSQACQKVCYQKGKKSVLARMWREGTLHTLLLLFFALIPRAPAFLLSGLPVVGSLLFCSFILVTFSRIPWSSLFILVLPLLPHWVFYYPASFLLNRAKCEMSVCLPQWNVSATEGWDPSCLFTLYFHTWNSRHSENMCSINWWKCLSPLNIDRQLQFSE